MGDYNKISEGVVEVPTAEGPVRFSSSVKPRTKARFENWIEARARSRVFVLKDELAPDEYHASMQAVQEAVGAGTFRWGGDACQQALRQIPGITYMIVLLAAEVEQVNGKIDEARILRHMSDPQVAPHMVAAFHAIVEESGPNFLLMPTREDLS